MFLSNRSINILLIFLLFLYYLFFINKGIVIYDEGYYAHTAERIINGEIPYKDFFIQFTPGYFYILALFYKLFGASILTGRILTVIICLGIGYLTLLIMDRFKSDLKLKILSLLAVASFGFPLINNMSLLAWPSVLLSLLAVLFFIEKKYVFLGIVLSLMLFTKQNLGIYFCKRITGKKPKTFQKKDIRAKDRSLDRQSRKIQLVKELKNREYSDSYFC